MATEGRKRRGKPWSFRRRRKPAARLAKTSPGERSAPAAGEAAEPAREQREEDDSPRKEERSHPPIKKGIYLSALVYIEGEQEPAENFDPVAVSALKKTLGKAFEGEHDGLTMSLKSVDVRNDIEQDDDEDVEGEEKPRKEKEERFQF